jgi:hypothetical protein
MLPTNKQLLKKEFGNITVLNLFVTFLKTFYSENTTKAQNQKSLEEKKKMI